MTSSRRPAVMVIAKRPEPGRSKTRLCPPLTDHQAAALAAAALADTFDAVLRCVGARPVLVLDGAAGPWIPAGFEVIPQVEGGLDERLAAAFATIGGPAVVIAMDTPQVTPALLESAIEPLVTPGTGGADVVLGPTADGGYWIIGLRDGDAPVIRGVPMSRPDTFEHQRRRVADAGLRLALVERLTDVDEIDDAVTVAAEIPGSRFASTLGRFL